MSWSLNPTRGEVGLTLDGKVYPMLPQKEVAARIEGRLGSVLTIFRRLVVKDGNLLTMREMAVIAFEGITAAGRDRKDVILQNVSEEVLEQKIFDEGLLDCAETFAAFMANLMSGGTKPKKKLEQDPSTTTTSISAVN